MIRPIPKRLLPHQATYKEYLGNTGEGDEWNEELELKFIKIEEKLQFRVNNNGRELVGNAKMFYDLVNSKGLLNKPTNNKANIEYTLSFILFSYILIPAKDIITKK